MTIILTTHYLEEAEQMCDQIAILNHGQIVAQDSTRNLLGQLDAKTMVIQPETPPPQMPNLPGVRVEPREDGGLAFHYHATQTSAEDVLQGLRAAGIRIRDVRTEQADLEAVFLSLTRASA
jgi:ABC-2 type transport system ATP-binding protein